jgi:flavin-dependent dehydrogenase
MIDLLVVGGGPVGMVAALEAAERGLRVVVVESRDGDGDKACGEGLMPSAVAALSRLGVHPPGADLVGVTYLRGTHRASAEFRDRPGRGVRRTALVAALRDRLEIAGVETAHMRVTHLEQHRDGVRVGPLQARYVAVADGLHSPLRRDLGLQTHARGPARYGLRRHVATAAWSDHVEVYWGEHSEAYVTPVGPSEVGVAVLGAPGRTFEQRLAEFPELADRLAGAPVSSRVRGAGPLRQSASARVRGRALLVGDAAGYVDALTGEGLAVGFAGAGELVQCVVAGRPEAYEARWRRATRRPRLITETLLGSTRVTPVRRALVPAAQRLPGVFAAAVNQLA